MYIKQKFIRLVCALDWDLSSVSSYESLLSGVGYVRACCQYRDELKARVNIPSRDTCSTMHAVLCEFFSSLSSFTFPTHAICVVKLPHSYWNTSNNPINHPKINWAGSCLSHSGTKLHVNYFIFPNKSRWKTVYSLGAHIVFPNKSR